MRASKRRLRYMHTVVTEIDGVGQRLLEDLEGSLGACGALLDDEGRIIDVSEGFRARFGAPRDLARSRLMDLLPRPARERFEALLEAVLAGRPSGSLWVPGEPATGTSPLEIRLVRPRNPADPLPVVIFDRRERETLENHLLHSDRLRILGEMLSESVHELNNLIGVVRNAACSPSAGDAESLDLIRRAAEDALQVTGALQRFGRAPDHPVEPELFDLADVVREAVEFTRPRRGVNATPGPLELETSLDPGARVRGEPLALRHVVVNLIANAVDAMPGGGRLRIACSREEGDVVVRVSDTGPGLDRSVAERALDPFVSSKGEGGSGLGLSIASTTVARHGGSLAVDSWEGGTSVEMRLPCADAARRRRKASRPRPKPQRVLLVEPRPGVRDLMTGQLRRDGHRVVAVADAAEAAPWLEGAQTPSLVVCSLDLQAGSGLELISRLVERKLRIPLLLMSGWGLELDLGFDSLRDCIRVLHKPVRMSALRRAVLETQAVSAA